MSRRTRVLVALAVIALVSPLIPTAAALHVLFDHDQGGEHHVPDGDSGLHGHAHPAGTPSHEHGLSAPTLGTSTFRTDRPAVFATGSSSAPSGVVEYAFGPHPPCEAPARASPPGKRSSVLRI